MIFKYQIMLPMMTSGLVALLFAGVLFECQCSAFQPSPIQRPSRLSQSPAITLYLAKKKNKANKKPLVAAISSTDGQVKRSMGSLGVSQKPKNKPKAQQSHQQPLSKKDRQRTGNGQVDSTKQTLIADPENEAIQVLEAKRGNKVVTIVRGMTSPMDKRKTLLKDLKKSFGVGGTLVEGVLEIQGAYAERAVQVLHKKGYVKARKIGK